MAKTLDEQVEAFRTRALDAGPYTFVWLDALTQNVREGGRIGNVHCLVATGVNADGRRQIWTQIWSNCEDRLVPSGRGPGPWSNWPCCLWIDLPVLAPGGACWRRAGRRVPIGALPLQGTVTVLTVTPARRRPSPHRSFKEPDDHRQHARARRRPPDRRLASPPAHPSEAGAVTRPRLHDGPLALSEHPGCGRCPAHSSVAARCPAGPTCVPSLSAIARKCTGRACMWAGQPHRPAHGFRTAEPACSSRRSLQKERI